MQLTTALSDEMRNAFRQLIENASEDDFYGFAIYTDDSPRGVDIAANSRAYLSQRLRELPDSRRRVPAAFSLKWYPTEWKYEGGYADFFSRSDVEICKLCEAIGTAARAEVFTATFEALKALRSERFFEAISGCEDCVVLFSITDSEDDEEFMMRSIYELNSVFIRDQFLAERACADE